MLTKIPRSLNASLLFAEKPFFAPKSALSHPLPKKLFQFWGVRKRGLCTNCYPKHLLRFISLLGWFLKRWFWLMFTGPPKPERGHKKRNDGRAKARTRNEGTKMERRYQKPERGHIHQNLFFTNRPYLFALDSRGTWANDLSKGALHLREYHEQFFLRGPPPER